MTYNKRKTTTIATFVLATFVLTMSIPYAFADNPPYKNNYWYDYKGDPEVCYLESELDNMTVNGTTNQGSAVIAAVELTRAEYNSKIDGLTIGAVDSTCSYNNIKVGARSLDFGIAAQAQLSAYYCCGNNHEYAGHFVDFNTDIGWKTNNDECGFFDNKDIEWIANHEFGHALGLDHHSGGFHSVMGELCSSAFAEVQPADKAALESLY